MEADDKILLGSAAAGFAMTVAAGTWVGVGAADEEKGEEGQAHVFKHMLFKGTKKRALGEITEIGALE